MLTRISGRGRVLAVALALAVTLGVVTALSILITMTQRSSAAKLTEVADFGENPSNLEMHRYVPDDVAANAPVLLAMHGCAGTGPSFYADTEFASLADDYGFIVIYPSATREGQCWDVSSRQALTRDGGSDPVGLASMVDWVSNNHDTDPDRVYATGSSSGAMMTNVMLGNYPDLFTAGSAFVGVPFGCFATDDGSGWNSACADGEVDHTPQEWGDLVRAAHPDHSGPRPRMQLWHGTEDDILRYPNLGEEIEQWTDVLGVSQDPEFTDEPEADWTRTRYGDSGAQPPVEAISVQGAGHALPSGGMAAYAIDFFGLD